VQILLDGAAGDARHLLGYALRRGVVLSKKPPTVEEQNWMRKISIMGCIACKVHVGAFVPAEVHHMTSGGRRMGHLFTLPLCPYHHRGVIDGGMDEAYVKKIYGPSVSHGRKEFEGFFGAEEDLLKQVQQWVGWPNKNDLHPSTVSSSLSSTTSE